MLRLLRPLQSPVECLRKRRPVVGASALHAAAGCAPRRRRLEERRSVTGSRPVGSCVARTETAAHSSRSAVRFLSFALGKFQLQNNNSEKKFFSSFKLYIIVIGTSNFTHRYIKVYEY